MDVEHLTLVQALYLAASENPQSCACVHLTEGQEVSMTWQTLLENTKKVAAALMPQVTSKDRVLLVYPVGTDFLPAFFACLMVDVIPVAVSVPVGFDSMLDVQRIVENVLPELCLTTQSVMTHLQSRTKRWLQQIPILNKFCDTESELDGLKWFCTDILSDPAKNPLDLPEIKPDSLAMLQHTIGVQGNSVEVMLSHSNVMYNLEKLRKEADIRDDDSFISCISGFQSEQLLTGILLPLFLKRPLYLMSTEEFQENPVKWLRAISRYGISCSLSDNSVWEIALSQIKADEKKSLNLADWELAFCIGESLHPSLLENFFRAFRCCGFRREIFYPISTLIESTNFMFGSSRNCGADYFYADKIALSVEKVVRLDGKNEDACGLLTYKNDFENQKIRVIHPESFTLCQENEPGEIWVSSASKAMGYWGQPHQSKEVFDNIFEDEFSYLRTGICGFLDNSKVIIMGKLTEQIHLNGRIFYPQAIEYYVGHCHSDLKPGSVMVFGTKKAGQEQLVIFAEIDGVTESRSKAIFSTIKRCTSEHQNIYPDHIWLVPKSALKKNADGTFKRILIQRQFLEHKIPFLFQWTEKRSPVMDLNFMPVHKADIPVQPEQSLAEAIAPREPVGLPVIKEEPIAPIPVPEKEEMMSEKSDETVWAFSFESVVDSNEMASELWQFSFDPFGEKSVTLGKKDKQP